MKFYKINKLNIPRSLFNDIKELYYLNHPNIDLPLFAKNDYILSNTSNTIKTASKTVKINKIDYSKINIMFTYDNVDISNILFSKDDCELLPLIKDFYIPLCIYVSNFKIHVGNNIEILDYKNLYSRPGIFCVPEDVYKRLPHTNLNDQINRYQAIKTLNKW